MANALAKTARRDCLPLALRGNRPSSATAGCS